MIVVDKSTIDFSFVSVFDTKQDSFVVLNTGTESVSVSIVSSSLEFTLSQYSFSLLPLGRQSIFVYFNPLVANVFSENLTITSPENILTVNLLAESVSAEIYVNRTSINFGNVSINSPKTEILLVSNISADEINLILSSVTSSNPLFRETISTYKIAKGNALSIPIVFTPVMAGAQSSTLEIHSNDLSLPIISVDLTGSGIIAPNITVSTSFIDFGSVEISKTVTKKIKINNVGVDSLLISSIMSSNIVFSVSPSGALVAPGSFVEVSIIYLPIAKVQTLAKLTITSNDPDTPVISIDLQGTGASPVINVSPQVLDFSFVSVGNFKKLPFVITNSTSFPLVVSNISSSDSDFTINEIFPIEIVSSKSIDVTFEPVVLGTKSSTLIITSNDYSAPTVNIITQGTGAHPNIIVKPSVLNFGIIGVNISSNLPVTITNSGLGKLLVLNIISSNPDFISSDTVLEIESNSSKFVTISFVPTSQGSKTGIIQFINNDPDSPNINLSVSGFGAYPNIAYSPNFVNFGQVVVGSSKQQNITINNTGLVDLRVDISSNSSQFVVSSFNLLVPSRSSSAFTITFSHSSTGDFSGIISLLTNDQQQQNIAINVIGKSINSPKIVVTPKSLSFDRVSVGGSKTLTTTVSNAGTEILNFSANIKNPLRFLGFDYFSVAPDFGTINPSGSMLLSVTFSPKSLETLESVLLVESNDITEQKVEVSLQGTIIPAVLEWNKINTEKWVPKTIYTMALSLTQVIDPLITALDITTQVLNVIKLFIIDIADPMKIIIEQLKKTIDNFINDLSATGLYALYIMPGQLGINPFKYPQYFRDLPKDQYNIFDINQPSWFDCVKGGYSSFISKIIGSFDDPGDGNRPQLSSNAMVGGYVMMFDSGTIGPDNVANFIKSIQKLMKLFRSPFRVAFEPPSNVSCFAGNKIVRVTFTPSSSILPKEYFVFRSETQGGDVLYYEQDGKSYAYHDENGNVIRSYELIGVTNVVQQFSIIAGISRKDAETKLGEFGYAAKEISKSVLSGDPLRFVYEDDNVDNDKTYYYVVAAGYTTLSGFNYSSIPNDVKSTDFEKKVVSTVDPDTKKFVGNIVNPRSVTETKIIAIGLLSAEVSAMPIDSTFEVKGGLARCRNFRCGFDEDVQESVSYNGAEAPDFIIIGHTPIAGSVKIMITRDGEQFRANTSSYRVQYTPKNENDEDLRFYQSTTSKIFIKSRYYFKSGDILEITYKYKKNLSKKSKVNESVKLDNNRTFITAKKPIDSTSVEVFSLPGRKKLANSEFMVLNDKDGKIKVSIAGAEFLVNYTYFSDFSNSEFFKCIKPEFSRYFFDIAKCDAGSTLCTGYDNANCFYNNGSVCTNTDISQRRVLSIRSGVKDAVRGFEPENIPFNQFWDPISCQNGMMQQRCDGYSKTFPRYTPKVWPDWSSVRLSAIGLFPQIDELMKIMQGLLDSLLAGTEKMSNSITNFIDLLQKKIDSLRNLLENIKSILVVITEDFALPNLYFLRIPYGSGGNEYLKTSIQNAMGGPNLDNSAYTSGIVFVYTTPGLGDALKLFFG